MTSGQVNICSVYFSSAQKKTLKFYNKTQLNWVNACYLLELVSKEFKLFDNRLSLSNFEFIFFFVLSLGREGYQNKNTVMINKYKKKKVKIYIVQHGQKFSSFFFTNAS